MKIEIDHIIDDLLAKWHRWRQAAQMVKGYAGTDSTCRDYRAPTHWDWLNGAEDDRADDVVMRGVDKAVDRIPQPWNTVVQFDARNIATGATVWRSPRLPTGEALEVLKIEARNKLFMELRREGIVAN